MSVFQISDDVYSVGVLNPNLRVFDIIMKTDYGTSYNSYIIKAEKITLVETCHHAYFDEYLDNIRQVCDPCEIANIILNHTEPDHSGALARLTELCPNAQIICSKAASIYLRQITNNPALSYHTASDGETISLGNKNLKFINAPFLHWPDSMFTYLIEDEILFSCDFLGGHYCEPRMIDRYVTYPAKYEAAFKGYYDAIFGPFPSYVKAGLDKIAALSVKTACTSHGPVLTKGEMLDYAIRMYSAWCVPHLNIIPTIPIFYCSAYGNTKKIAAQIAKAINDTISAANCEIYDIIDHTIPELAEKLNTSDAFLIGSPTINRDAVAPIWQLLSHIDAINNQKKPCGVFGSYGWSGEAVPSVTSRLSQLKLKVFEEGLKVNFVPSDKELQDSYDFGVRFAQSLSL